MKQIGPEIITRADNRDWILHLNRHYCDITPMKNAPFGIVINELKPSGTTTRHTHEVVELFLVTKGQVEAKLGPVRTKRFKTATFCEAGFQCSNGSLLGQDRCEI